MHRCRPDQAPQQAPGKAGWDPRRPPAQGHTSVWQGNQQVRAGPATCQVFNHVSFKDLQRFFVLRGHRKRALFEGQRCFKIDKALGYILADSPNALSRRRCLE